MKAIPAELYFRQCSFKRMLENENKSVTKQPSETAKRKHQVMRDIEDSAMAKEYGLSLSDIV